MHYIYWLLSEDNKKTYVGFTGNLDERMRMHRNDQVKSTKGFGNFRIIVLDNVDDVGLARSRERYWKSAAGRKKLKDMYGAIV